MKIKITNKAIRKSKRRSILEDESTLDYLIHAMTYGEESSNPHIFANVLDQIMRRNNDDIDTLAIKTGLSSRTIRRYINGETQGVNLKLAAYIIRYITSTEIDLLYR